MNMHNGKSFRVLAFDTSLTLPGASIIEVKNGKPKIIALSHIKTDSKTQTHALRTEIVESWATLFIAEHIGKGIDKVYREDFHGQSSSQNYPVFAAWSGCERACSRFNLTFEKFHTTTKSGRKKTLLGIPQSTVKKLVAGKGVCEKPELAEHVRKMTGYKGDFETYDESDSVAVSLAFLLHEGVIAK
jgi:crossover junction endodeoxyribonuclease RuvC